jgi:hypothetical protein
LDETLSRLAEAPEFTGKAQQLRAQLSGASPQAIDAFRFGVGLRRSGFRDMVRHLRQLPSAPQPGSGKDRPSYLSAARARYEQSIAALQSVCSRDIGGIQ